MDLSELATPFAVVDRLRVRRNAERMRERARDLGVRLRPHVKTHKCVEIARLELGTATGPIAVSTLAEARAFAAAGFGDITYAVPISHARVREVVDLVRAGLHLGVLVDHPDTVAELERQAMEAGVRLRVWLKADSGYHRAGVDPTSDDAVALAARIAASSGLALAGVLTHAGHAYACRDREEVAAVAVQERDVTVAFAERLRAADVAVPEVSVGSTPTASVVADLSGVTEIRPGNYAFFDAFQAAIGSCRLDDCAFTVVASVIGAFPRDGRLVIDAGALALSKDSGPVHVDPRCGFGVVCDLAGEPLAGLRVASLSQEHGVVSGPPDTIGRHRIGGRLRIVPNHSCLAAACFDRYHVVEDQAVVDEWWPVRGW
ncbi:MAG: alanine racemase [Thermoanaerobaculaceae bacterium]